jgi:hypothetical protein
MMSKSRWNVGAPSLVALFAVLVVACSPAQAQVKPFKIYGEGIATQGLPLPGQPARPHWIVGNATDLGLHHGAGTVATDSADFHPNGMVTGEFGSGSPFVFENLHHEKLVCEYGRVEFGASTPGTFTLVPIPQLGPGAFVAIFVAEFIPVPAASTGKFKGVTGGWNMIAVTAPFILGASDPVLYWWVGDGSLTYKARH